MARKDLYQDMGLTNMAYLLDPSVVVTDPAGELDINRMETVQLSKLHNFKNHPFKVDVESDDFIQLLDSVKEYGILYPLLIRPDCDGYEIVSGHRRKLAATMAGLSEVPVIIRSMNDYEATVVMVHSNLHREKISYSEKAKAYRMCVEAEKHQGKVGGDTAAIVGQGHDSRRQVYRYVRLSYLSEELLGLVDGEKIAFNTGVELAYLDSDSQQELLVYIEQSGKFPSLEQAKKLRTIYESNKKSLSYEMIVSELIEAPKQKVIKNVSFKTKDLAGYFREGTKVEEMSNVILVLLEKYRNGDFDEIMKAEK